MSLEECHPKTRQATVSQAQEVTNLHQHHCTVHCAVHQPHPCALCCAGVQSVPTPLSCALHCDAGVQVATDPLQK